MHLDVIYLDAILPYRTRLNSAPCSFHLIVGLSLVLTASHFIVGIAIESARTSSSRQLDVTVFHLVWNETAPLP